MAAHSRTGCVFRLSIARAVRAVVPKTVPLGARITGSDWREGGLTADNAVAIAKALKSEGFDFICISSGGVAADIRNPTEPGYNVPIAARVKKEVRHSDPNSWLDHKARARRGYRGQGSG